MKHIKHSTPLKYISEFALVFFTVHVSVLLFPPTKIKNYTPPPPPHSVLTILQDCIVRIRSPLRIMDNTVMLKLAKSLIIHETII